MKNVYARDVTISNMITPLRYCPRDTFTLGALDVDLHVRSGKSTNGN